jgi:Zn-dependent protease with chaperone function
MTAWLRAVLAIALLWGIYVLAVVLVAVDVGIIILFGVEPGKTQFYFLFGITITSVPTAAAVLVALFTVSRETGPLQDSVELSPDQAPALWTMVNELAGAVGTRPPTEVRVVATANAQVSEECRFLGLIVGTRRLYVGLPLMLGLTVDELRAILCHELGHYARSHTRTGTIAYRGATILREIMAWFLRPEPAGRRRKLHAPMFEFAFSRYAISYFRLSATVRRQQEREADAAAVAAAGKAAASSALRGTYATGQAWNDFLSRYVGTVLRHGFVPDGLFEGFSAMLADPLYQDVLAAARQSPPDNPPARFDTHPSIATRLRQIGEVDDEAGEAVSDRDLTPATSLLAEPRQVFMDVQKVALPPVTDPERRLPWPEWADLVALVRAVEAATELLTAARRVAVEPAPALSTVLDLLRDGAASKLAAALGKADSPEAALGHLRRSLEALVGCLLVRAGYASWRLSWTEPGILTGLDVAVVEFRDLVVAAVNHPGQVDHLRAHLVYLGIDLTRPLTSTEISLRGRAGPLASASALSLPGPGAAPPHRSQSITEVTIALFVLLVLAGVIAAAVRGDHKNTFSDSGQQQYLPTQPAPQFTEPVPRYSPLVSPGYLLPSLMPGIHLGQPLTFHYTVRPGDSLSSIACRFITTVSALQRLNHLGGQTVIHPGQTLLVPGLEGLIDTVCG